MDWILRERVCSIPRMGRYLQVYGKDQARAGVAYDHNLLLAQALMPALQTVEVALRNAIHARLSRSMRRPDWWAALTAPEFAWLGQEIAGATGKLQFRREQVTPDKLVAELTFGCWTRLFNVAHQHSLWKPLSLAFPNLAKHNRQRHTVSAPLNRIRDLRNRVMHHEPLLWLKPSVVDVHAEILQVLDWIEPRIQPWLLRLDSVHTTWVQCQKI